MHLILASASPRRAELLRAAGFTFDVAPTKVDETPRADELPGDYVLRVARAKALRVANDCQQSGSVVLAADTVVVVKDRLLGQPSTAAEAESMLKALSGVVHAVHTGVVVRCEDREWAEVVTTRVRLLKLSDREIDWYVGTGEPEGKAGAYAIQGRASRFVEWIEGSWSNVVGLPISTVYRMLRKAGQLD